VDALAGHPGRWPVPHGTPILLPGGLELPRGLDVEDRAQEGTGDTPRLRFASVPISYYRRQLHPRSAPGTEPGVSGSPPEILGFPFLFDIPLVDLVL
jgi:hypothetical protein